MDMDNIWMFVLHIETLHASIPSCETLGQRWLGQSGKQSYVGERKISPEQHNCKASVHAGVYVYVLLQSSMQTSTV